MKSKRTRSVLFISGCRAGTTFEYRVLQKQEQLALQNVQVTVREGVTDREKTLEQISSHDVLCLYRLAHSPFVDRMIDHARGRDIPVIFDVDDLVFEPSLVHWVDPVKTMSEEDAALYYEGVWRYRQTLQASDYALTSTDYLADLARGLGLEAFVHRNGVSQWMIKEADAMRKPHTTSANGQVTIGYGSGTDTHRKDLAEIADALAEILTRHADVELRIVGPMELPVSLKRFEGRIRHIPLVPWREWLSILNTFDVNLAPLESGNPFCEAKSEIKYTEAGLLGIPTVASRIKAYELAIRDGETGFLADDADAWVSKLERLVTNPDLRREMGEAARSHVLAHYGPEALGQRLARTLNTIQDLYARKKASALNRASDLRAIPLILNWIFPEPIPGSGGHMDIIRMINLLSGFGHHNNAYVVPRRGLWDQSDQEIRDALRHQFAHLKASLYKWNGGPMMASDAVVLTHWSTAYMIDEVENTSKVFYFVQDWEPFFFPMGTQYLRAEQTYKMGFSCITLGPWLTERLTTWYDADADYFDFAVDHDIYYPRAVDKPDRPRICFYARPSTPRRLFPMGVEALKLVHDTRPEVEIVFYGVSDAELQRERVPFPHTNRGILSEKELAELFSSCDLGIVLSPTNCSLVPPEMMACKCAVVDLNRETVKGVLDNKVNAMLAEPTPQGIAEAVLRLLDDEPLRKELIETAYRQIQERSWDRSARRVEQILYEKLPVSRCVVEQRRFDGLPTLPSLANLPVKQQEVLNQLHEKRCEPTRRWAAQLKEWAKRLLRVERGTLLNGKAVGTLGELKGKRRIGQTFVAQHDGLHRIDLLVGTYGRRNTRDVVLHLKESPETAEDLATACLNASLLADNAYARFILEPQPDSSGKPYYLCIESPESVPGDAITLWAYNHVDLVGVRRYENGQASEGQLIFGLFYMDGRLGEVGERPLLRRWARRSTLLWGRLQKAYRLLAARDLDGLRREVTSYWKWKTGKT